MASQRRSGIIYFKVDGIQYRAKGNFSYNLGQPKREAVIGASGVEGYKETPQPAFIEGELSDDETLDLEKLVKLDNVTPTLELTNGKVIVLREAWFAGEGTGQTEDANIAIRFEARFGEEIR